MTERPINCTADEVRGLLAGTLTELRREIVLPPAPNHLGTWEPTTIGGEGCVNSRREPVPEEAALWHTRTGQVQGYFPIGTVLWARETLNILDWDDTDARLGACVQYAASVDGEYHGCLGWTHDVDADVSMDWGKPRKGADLSDQSKPIRVIPPTQMPRWACRLTLTIADVRVEREDERWVWVVRVAKVEGGAR